MIVTCTLKIITIRYTTRFQILAVRRVGTITGVLLLQYPWTAHAVWLCLHCYLFIKWWFSIVDYRGLVRGLTPGLLNEHEIITLAREYGEKSWPPLSSLVRIVHTDLKQRNFTAFRSDSMRSQYLRVLVCYDRFYDGVGSVSWKKHSGAVTAKAVAMSPRIRYIMPAIWWGCPCLIN